jgi:hypothetical protein
MRCLLWRRRDGDGFCYRLAARTPAIAGRSAAQAR